MYRCQITGRQSRDLEKLNKIVAVTRQRQYKHFDRETEEDWFSHGTEIVLELNANEEGLRLWNGWTEEQRALWLKERGYSE
jgi:hypothetical protein